METKYCSGITSIVSSSLSILCRDNSNRFTSLRSSAIRLVFSFHADRIYELEMTYHQNTYQAIRVHSESLQYFSVHFRNKALTSRLTSMGSIILLLISFKLPILLILVSHFMMNKTRIGLKVFSTTLNRTNVTVILFYFSDSQFLVATSMNESMLSQRGLSRITLQTNTTNIRFHFGVRLLRITSSYRINLM